MFALLAILSMREFQYNLESVTKPTSENSEVASRGVPSSSRGAEIGHCFLVICNNLDFFVLKFI